MDYPIGTVERRNQRERYRVKSINSTFRVLEAMLPSPRRFGKLKKPSKADILHNAIIYIESLQSLINSSDPTSDQLTSLQQSTTPKKDGMLHLPALATACGQAEHQFEGRALWPDNFQQEGNSTHNNEACYQEDLGCSNLPDCDNTLTFEHFISEIF